MGDLRLKVFGGFKIETASGDAVPLRQRRAQALLGYLAMNAGQEQRRDKLASLLWSRSDDEHARQSLRQTIRELRKLAPLADHAGLVFTSDAMTIEPDELPVDVADFKTLLANGSIECLEKALDIYSGEFLDGLDINEPVYEEWLIEARRGLNDAVLQAMLKLLDAYQRDDAVEASLRIARRILSVDKFQETAHRAVMRCLDRLGRRTEAIQHYNACLETLKSELGVDPSEATVSLYQDILKSSGEYQTEQVAAEPPSTDESRIPVANAGLAPMVRYASLVALALVVAFVTVWFQFAPQVTTPERPPGDIDTRPSGPSIAVLPFDNLSNDPAQDFFADGVAAEILARLAAFSDLKVIARNSSFQYRGMAVDVREIGRDLGAGYVLEGSVRRDAGTVRVTAQLVDTGDGAHMWSETYERDLSATGIFEIQNEIASRISATLAGVYGVLLERDRMEAKRKPPESLVSYDCVLLAKVYWEHVTLKDYPALLECLEKAVATEPDYVDGWVWLSEFYTSAYDLGLDVRPEPLALGLSAAERAVALAPRRHDAHGKKAIAHFFLHERDAFLAEADITLKLNPNDPDVLADIGLRLSYMGE
jgi:TolB-like protein/DNA-binding SARP family transcriptional activator